MNGPLMGQLMKDIREDKKGTFGRQGEGRVMHSTGFTLFDYKNGQFFRNDDGSPGFHRGLDAGKLLTIIGKSGTGKSSMAIQMAHNITKGFENSTVFIKDFEQANEKERVQSLTGMTTEYFEQKWSILSTNISTETVFGLIKKIEKFKLEHRDQLLVEVDGVEILPPTVMIVDSIPTMIPAAQGEKEEMSGGMDATAIAKANTQLFKRIMQPCVSANIMVIFINHITDDVNLGIMPKQAALNYGLRQGESLPGGKAPTYLTNTLIRLTSSTKIKEDATFKLPGFEVKVEFGKSRTAPAGTVFNMIFDTVNGYQEELSLLKYLMSAKKHIGGSGRAYYLKDENDNEVLAPDGSRMTFTAANFRDKINEFDPIFKKKFYEFVEGILQAEVRMPNRAEIEQAKGDAYAAEAQAEYDNSKEQASAAPAKDYEAMTVAQLKEEAKAAGHTVAKSAKKADIIALLTK